MSLITHADCALHDPGPDHSEGLRHLAAVNDALVSLPGMEPDDGWITRKPVYLTDHHCGGRVVSVLEGATTWARSGAAPRHT